MIEFIIEYLFSLVDYAYLLYFYLYLNHDKINMKKRSFIAILLMALIQYASELFVLPKFISSVKDNIFIFLFLLLYGKKKNINNSLNALMISSLFLCLLSLCVNIANMISINIGLTLVFGMYRIIFSIVIKACIILMMYLILSQLRKVEFETSNKTFMITIICLSICGILASYILQLSEGNQNWMIAMILIEIIAFSILYFSLTYNILMKKNYHAIMFQELIALTEQQIDEISLEHKQTEILIHDVKNQMLEIDDMAKRNETDKIHEYINQWMKSFVFSHVTPLCLNIYVDHVLRQKMKEYPMILFHIKLQIPEHIPMNTTDLLSFITMILDKSCKSIKQHDDKNYYFELKGNDHELNLYESYYYDTESKKNDSFSESYIKELIEKYDGTSSTVIKESIFTQSILLIL